MSRPGRRWAPRGDGVEGRAVRLAEAPRPPGAPGRRAYAPGSEHLECSGEGRPLPPFARMSVAGVGGGGLVQVSTSPPPPCRWPGQFPPKRPRLGQTSRKEGPMTP